LPALVIEIAELTDDLYAHASCVSTNSRSNSSANSRGLYPGPSGGGDGPRRQPSPP